VSSDHLALIDDGTVIDLPARFRATGARIGAGAISSALGWELKPEGLCRAGVCIPVRDRTGLIDDDGVDLAELARLLGRPLALDVDERAAYLGTSAHERAAQLATLAAPDFSLPDLAGRLHSLSAQRGKKVLLIAYASW
jgi:hypothetical protein